MPDANETGSAALNPEVPSNEVGRSDVLEQLERLLNHDLFRQSKRYSSVLQYIVARAVKGGSDSDLKERTIGIEALGRDPAFDTNTDPTVRVVASEIRKRLILYYQQPGHESEIRIDLPPGSYVPKFRVPSHSNALPAERPWWSGRARWAAITICAAAAAAGAWLPLRASKSALNQFWAPVLEGAPSVLLSVGERSGTWGYPPGLVGPGWPPSSNLVPLSDVQVLMLFGHFLDLKGVKHAVQAGSATTVADLRNSPAILIGFNNYWTQRVTGTMRFRLRNNPSAGSAWIEDQKNPSRMDWSESSPPKNSEISTEYALVTRALDPSTGRFLVTVAGLSGAGTMAAADFLVNPAAMESMARQWPEGWGAQNLEIVIKTELINRSPAATHLVATHFW